MKNLRKWTCTCLTVALAFAALPALADAAARPVVVALQGPDMKPLHDAVVAYRNAAGEMVKTTLTDGGVVAQAIDGKVVLEIDSAAHGIYVAEFVVPETDKVPVHIALDQNGNANVTLLIPNHMSARKSSETKSVGLDALMSKVGDGLTGKFEFAGGGSCPAGGSGDECTAPIVVSAGTHAGTLLDNTGTVDDTSCAFNDDIDEWYCYVAPCDGMAMATTCNAPATDFDTTLAVFDGCGGAEIICNDDQAGAADPACATTGGPNRGSTVSWAVTGGSVYFIRVSAFNNAVGAGNFELTITDPDCGGGGDACPAAGDGDECDAPIVVSAGTHAGTLLDNTGTVDDTSCAFNDDIDEWYCYTAPCDGMAMATTCNAPATDFDTTLAVFDGCGGAEIICNDDQAGAADPACATTGGPNRGSTVSWAVTGGTAYFIRVSAFNNAVGAGNFELTITDPDCGGGGGCPAAGDGDECDAPIVVSAGTHAGTLLDNTGTVDDTSCAFNDDIDEWYCYTAPCDGMASATTCNVPGTDFDTTLAVFDACGGAEIICNDDQGGGAVPECDTTGIGSNRGSTVSWAVTGGTAYFIRVSAFNNAVGAGNFELTITDPDCGGGGGDCPPAGDGNECDAPIVVSDGTFGGDLADNTGATGNDSSCGGTGDTIDEWYCYTATCDGNATATTCLPGTQFDTTLAVYSACGGGEITCNDDTAGAPAACDLSGLNRKSTVTWPVSAGSSYFIRVSVFGDDFMMQGGFGTAYELSISCVEVGPIPDDCDDAAPISGVGTYPFDNSTATTDGLPDGLCLAFGSDQIENDVWFCWTSDCDQNVEVTTVGLTGVDTRIAVYDGCTCPTGNGILACNDDSLGTLQSTVSFPATSGNTYLIRIGNFPGATPGSGMFDISCVAPPMQICFEPAPNCQDYVTDNASQSNDTAFRSADDFTPAASGDITDVCWWGAYIPAPTADSFTVTYYDDAGGVPGSVIGGPFSGGGLTVMGPEDTGDLVAGIAPIWEYTGSHAPVSVTAGNCYWIEIKNNPAGSTWFWEWSFSGNGRKIVDDELTGYDVGDIDLASDFAFCLNLELGDPAACLPPPADNDDCEDATDIAGEGTFPFDTTLTTTDGPDHAACTLFGDDPGIANDVWYCWTAPCTSDVVFQTCGLTAVDTKIAVYDGCVCPTDDSTLLACNDDSCGLQSAVTFSAVAGQTYLLRVGTFPGSGIGGFPEAPGGLGSFSMTCIQLPDNDLCEDAIGPLAVPSVTAGTTVFATTDTGFPSPCGSGSITSPGVWYTVVGTGNTMTASMCNGATSFDAKLNVYCNVDCMDPPSATCVTGIDDFCGLQPEVSWCSQPGALYHILVHGFGGATGPFELVLSDSGAPCMGAIGCITLGACCLPDGTCLDSVSQFDCEAQDGVYQGDDTTCNGGFAGYVINDCGDSFEDISATGTPLNLSDDSGSVQPIGFTFNFFGVDQTMIAVCSNGYLTFGATLGDFSNDPIPSAATPNDMIAPLWDDFNPAAGGQVYAQTLGTAPNRRFIAQWDGVPQFGGADSNTFQAILFEGTNAIHFRYGAITPEGFAGDYSVGVENATGTEGVSVPGNSVAQGDCLAVTANTVPPIECPVEDVCVDCPPGTNPLVDADGNNSGWCWSTNRPTGVDIFVDDVVPGSHALIEISKDFAGVQSQFGLLPAILIDFIQVCEDDATVTMIRIADESITNLTSHDWTDFHWILFDGPEAWFDVNASGGFSVFPPFTVKSFEDFLDAPTNNMAKRLSAFGGVVPRFTSFFPGTGQGDLKIGINLSHHNPVSFVLKEVPTTDFVGYLSVDGGPAGSHVAVSPMDIFEATDGMDEFVRFYRTGTDVTLTAEANVNGRPFLRWVVDGVAQPVWMRTITVDVDAAVDATARYQVGPSRLDTPLMGNE